MNLLVPALLITYLCAALLFHIFVFGPRERRNLHAVLEDFAREQGCSLISFKRVSPFRACPLNSLSPHERRLFHRKTARTFSITARDGNGETREGYVRVDYEHGLDALLASVFVTGPRYFIEASMWLDEVSTEELQMHTTFARLAVLGWAAFTVVLFVLFHSYHEARQCGESG